jgi:hypothetical protein
LLNLSLAGNFQIVKTVILELGETQPWFYEGGVMSMRHLPPPGEAGEEALLRPLVKNFEGAQCFGN